MRERKLSEPYWDAPISQRAQLFVHFIDASAEMNL
jgi:hypothetical protein